MCFFYLFFGVIILCSQAVNCLQCHIKCPINDTVVCGLDLKNLVYKMFSSECARKAYSVCSNIDYEALPLRFCIKNHFSTSRRMYGESCPAFCPNYYRPVCGASKYRDYIYRSFTNGCYLDMINCRGDDDYTGFVEVPLQYCQRHNMKNIYKEKLVVSNVYDTLDYG